MMGLFDFFSRENLNKLHDVMNTIHYTSALRDNNTSD